MLTKRRIMIGVLGALVLFTLGVGAFFGARLRGGAAPVSASNGAPVASGGAAQVSAAADAQSAAGSDPYVFQYAGEFLCGQIGAAGATGPLGPGIYNTEISIHNANAVPVLIQKKAVPLLPNEQPSGPTPRVRLNVDSDGAFQADCSELQANTVLPGACVPFLPGSNFCKGYLVVEGGKPYVNPATGATTVLPAQLDMTVTTTVTNPTTGDVSIDVRLPQGKAVNYPCWSNTAPVCP